MGITRTGNRVLSAATKTITATTADQDVITAPSAGSLYIHGLSASNTSSTGVIVNIKDGTTIFFSMYLAPNGGGFTISFPIPLKLTGTNALKAATASSVTDVRVNAVYYNA